MEPDSENSKENSNSLTFVPKLEPKTCRLCLTPFPEVLKSMYENDEELKEMFEFVTGRKVSRDFPWICTDCEPKLKTASFVKIAAIDLSDHYFSLIALNLNDSLRIGPEEAKDPVDVPVANKKVNEKANSKEKSFICPICSKRLSRKQHLSSHIKSVHEHVKKFGCDLCGTFFSHKHHVAAHLKSQHETKKKI